MQQLTDRIRLVDFGRAVCNTDEAFGREWLVTNGIGGYASGTIGGIRRRRYHAALVAATDGPSVRTMLLGETAPTATYRGVRYPLVASQWADSSVNPRGHLWMQRFHLDLGIPVWRWSFSDALLERRIFMVHGQNTIVHHWKLVQASSPLQLDLNALVDCRSHHALGSPGGPTPVLELVQRGVRLTWPSRGANDAGGSHTARAATELHIRCDRAAPRPQGTWWKGFLLEEEKARGYDCIDALWHAASFEVELTPHSSTAFTASTTPHDGATPDELLRGELDRQRALVERVPRASSAPVLAQLVLAADQFVVARACRDGSKGLSIIAGYPWFGDWSRDTMISIPGLLLATGRVAEAQQVLSTWASMIEGGLLPNRFPDETSSEVEFNSVDAPLLMVIAAYKTWEAGADRGWLGGILPSLASIIDAYQRGTKHGIRVDSGDWLVSAASPGAQLTWMDAKVDGRMITARQGKPIEVNALWHEALKAMAAMAQAMGGAPQAYETAAVKVRASFGRYWNSQRSCALDVLDGPSGPERQVRPNQLFATRFGAELLPPGQCASIVDRCMSELWTPTGVRTLAPTDSAYRGVYSGNQASRDEAYHQGTVWPWLFAPLMKSHYGVHGDLGAIEDFLFPFGNHLREAGLGSVSEVFSGDPPHEPGGCPAQAWSVAAILEIMHFARSKSDAPPESEAKAK